MKKSRSGRLTLGLLLAPLVLAPLATACGGAASAPPSAPGDAVTSPARPEMASLCVPLRGAAAVEVVVLGSGGPRAAGRAGSSYAVLLDGRARILVDAGPGAFVRLGELGLDHRDLDVVLLTHLHIDHAADLPAIVKSRNLAYDQPVAFRIVGPAAGGPYPATTTYVDRLFGAEGAFAYLPEFRNRLTFDVSDSPAEPSVVVDVPVPTGEGLRVRAIPVDHGDVPAVAYRIEHGGHSAVVTGDLASKNDAVAKLAQGADLLFYDAAVLDPPGSPPNLYTLHTPPARIGEVASAAGVRRLVLSHIPPKVDAAREEVLSSVRASFEGDVQLAADCQRHVLH